MLMPWTTNAYSVFTHEELIDLTWRSAIRPLLLERFPGSTDAQLRQAHAFAYGGCDAQDMGYYPFGNKFFSQLTHYVRPGDFINNLFRESHNVNEYAFAIGVLSHYIGDSIGHSVAVNPSTGINFPKLAKKFGPIVTMTKIRMHMCARSTHSISDSFQNALLLRRHSCGSSASESRAACWNAPS